MIDGLARGPCREGLGALQQGERLGVERGGARRAHDAAVDHAPLPVEAEEDLRDALFAPGQCLLGVAFCRSSRAESRPT